VADPEFLQIRLGLHHLLCQSHGAVDYLTRLIPRKWTVVNTSKCSWAARAPTPPQHAIDV
jgi:hypothetical protein